MRECRALLPLLLLAACGGPQGGSKPSKASAAPAFETPSEPSGFGSRAEKATPSEIRATPLRWENPDAALLITDPLLLARLEERALSLAAVMVGEGPDTARLHSTSPRYRSFVDHVELDDSVARWRDPSARVGLAAAHRLFDPGWLKHSVTRFELVAIVNRLDRMHTTRAGCGELRLIYRLAYGRDRGSSRLPMTLNVVFLQQGDCRELARRWLALDEVDDLEQAVLEGFVAERGSPTRLESNFQSGRWPSGVRPSLGGHAEYVLRVFHVESERVRLGTLENTPTQRMDARTGRSFRRFVAEHAEAIDRGTMLLPDAFLAERTVSVQPRGLARRANRPFAQLIPAPRRTFASVDFTRLDQSRTPEGLLRRLDQMSCKGCHATRSLAGFHLLGEDREDTTPFNSIEVGISPHLLHELPWRRRFLRSIASGEPPPPRPFPERGASTGKLGDPCGLGDPTFGTWECAAGLVCKDRHGDAVGECAHVDGNGAGDAIEKGRMTLDRTGRKDWVAGVEVEPCEPIAGRDARAVRSANGFPNGICIAECERFGQVDGDAICGPVPLGEGTQFDGFTRCLATHRQSFDVCLADDAHPTWLRRCTRAEPCREDYLCVSVPDAPAGQGACMPPYFLFQARVDGHRVEDPARSD